MYQTLNSLSAAVGFHVLMSLSSYFLIPLARSPQIPSSAVEMPGSADVSGLNVQFGALDFGSEPSVIDMGHQAEPAREPVPTSVPQPQSSLFSKPGPVRCLFIAFSLA